MKQQKEVEEGKIINIKGQSIKFIGCSFDIFYKFLDLFLILMELFKK
jgi:FtsH-binding integral membrane protein